MKKPDTLKDYIYYLIFVIEESENYTQKEKSNLLDNIRKYLYSYSKLKEYVKDHLGEEK